MLTVACCKWLELGIDHETLFNEFRNAYSNNSLNFQKFSQFEYVKDWIEYIHDWKHNNIGYDKNNTTLMGAWGELAGALLLCHRTEFMQWVPTMAVQKGINFRRNNTNRDIYQEWTWLDTPGPIEIKTATSRTVTVPSIIPDRLFIVKALDLYKYEYYGMITPKDNINWRQSKDNSSKVWVFLDEIPRFRKSRKY